MWLLRQRAVLTRAVCHEVSLERTNADGLRSRAALDLLLGWIRAHFVCGDSDVHPGDHLPSMVVPPSGKALYDDIRAGVPVCEALWMLWTADTQGEYASDSADLADKVAAWSQYMAAQAGRR